MNKEKKQRKEKWPRLEVSSIKSEISKEYFKKDRNGKDLTGADDIKKRRQAYTEKLYKKDPNDPDNHDGMITHLESDILECEVKWTLRSIIVNKASGGDEIPVELFKILKDDMVKVLHLICQQIWKTQQWPQDWKNSVFIPIPKKGNAKECSNYHTIVLTSCASKIMLKILQSRLQQFMNQGFPNVQDGFRKGRGARDKTVNIGSQRKQGDSLKISTSASLTTPKPLTVKITAIYEKLLKGWEYQTSLPVS